MLTCNDMPALPFTFEAVVKIQSPESAADAQVVLAPNTDCNHCSIANIFRLQFVSGSLQFFYVYYTEEWWGTNDHEDTITAPESSAVDTSLLPWVHVALTIDTSNFVAIYQDGKLVGSKTLIGDLSTSYDASRTFTLLGRRSGYSGSSFNKVYNGLAGQFDEARFFSHALNSGQIEGNYRVSAVKFINDVWTPSPGNLVRIWTAWYQGYRPFPEYLIDWTDQNSETRRCNVAQQVKDNWEYFPYPGWPGSDWCAVDDPCYLDFRDVDSGLSGDYNTAPFHPRRRRLRSLQSRRQPPHPPHRHRTCRQRRG